MEDDLSLIFHDPVDLDAYPSYEEKVDEPMDFGTIKSKLDNWEYRRNDPLGFTRDVRLVRDADGDILPTDDMFLEGAGCPFVSEGHH